MGGGRNESRAAPQAGEGARPRRACGSRRRADAVGGAAADPRECAARPRARARAQELAGAGAFAAWRRGALRRRSDLEATRPGGGRPRGSARGRTRPMGATRARPRLGRRSERGRRPVRLGAAPLRLSLVLREHPARAGAAPAGGGSERVFRQRVRADVDALRRRRRPPRSGVDPSAAGRRRRSQRRAALR